MTRPRVRRSAAAVSLALLLASGLGVHFLLPDVAATDILGDILYAVAVYTGLVLIAPRVAPVALAAVAAAWGVAVELFQLTGVPAALGAEFAPAVLVLGTVFDPRDLVIALAAPLVAGALDHAVSVRARVSTDRAPGASAGARRR